MTGAGRLASGEEQSMMSSRMQLGNRARVGVGMQTVASSWSFYPPTLVAMTIPVSLMMCVYLLLQ